MFGTGMTCSHEQLVMDEEIAGMCRRMAAGIDVTDASIAQDLIREIGPRGTGYLTAGHTLERLRSREYLVPRLAVRGPRATWEAEGSQDTYALARQEARKLGARPVVALDEKRQAQLDAVVASLEPR
jgi:trimethylamine---corrinoid protein Co-methyltransferase